MKVLVLVARLSLVCVSLIVMSLMLTGQSSAKIDKKNIVGMWLLDKGKGTIAKGSSLNGNDGELMNGPKWVKGKFGMALEFDGVDDYVEVQKSILDAENSASICGWAKTSESGTYKGIFGNRPCIRKEKGGLTFRITNNNMLELIVNGWEMGHNIGTDYSSYIDGNWHFICGVYDGSNTYIYINGMEKAKGDYSKDIIASNYVDIGRYIWEDIGNDYYFNGLIDDVGIFNVALTEDDIKYIMTKGLSITSVVYPSGKLTTTWGNIKAQ
ncbi:MAG: LamG domain-containing protein [Planctomycetes bacterium]|nr:LamG domain-containing protein [Planctomycetota bacterium]